jgi:hypothetical protein
MLLPMNKTVLNERLKLLANWCNTVAAALVTTGVLGPIFAIIYGLSPKALDPALVFTSSLVCILVSAALHLAGRSFLDGLQE